MNASTEATSTITTANVAKPSDSAMTTRMLNGVEVIETQADRTDLPLVVIPRVIDAMAAPFEAAFPMLNDVARVRMFNDATLDEATVAARSQDADALGIIDFHCSDEFVKTVGAHAKCFAFGGTGIQSYINFALAKELGIRLCNIRHYGDNAVAELAFALMLELARHVGRLNDEMHADKWIGDDGVELHGKTLAIIGLGGIGRTVAGIANAFGMHVTAWDSGHSKQDYAAMNITPIADMKQLIAQADIVSIHMPLLPSTRGMITADELDAIQPGTFFINTARAEIIEEGALVKRLERGDIYAGLDVYYEEPLPADSPLRSMKNVVLTPHIGWRADGAYKAACEQVIESLKSYFTGGDFNVAQEA